MTHPCEARNMRQTKILSVTYKIALHKVGAAVEYRTYNFSFILIYGSVRAVTEVLMFQIN